MWRVKLLQDLAPASIYREVCTFKTLFHNAVNKKTVSLEITTQTKQDFMDKRQSLKTMFTVQNT